MEWRSVALAPGILGLAVFRPTRYNSFDQEGIGSGVRGLPVQEGSVKACLSLVFALVLAWPGQAPQTPLAGTATSSKVWIGRNADYEQALKTAPIVKREDISTGVTHPVRLYFAPGGLVASAIMKSVNEGLQATFLDSYRSEIAAYEIDRLLGLDMVPPTVERDVDRQPRSLQLWAENCRSLKKAAAEPRPDPEAWNRQVYRMRVFDNLIMNIDRNEGNILIDAAWNIILIDHSRALDGRRDVMPFPMTKIDGPFLEKLKALDKKTLQQRVGPWVVLGVDPILKQRDKIVKHFETLAAQQGEANVIIR
jgi:hypothetical protein